MIYRLMMAVGMAVGLLASPVLPAGKFVCETSGEAGCAGGASQLSAVSGIAGVKQWLDGEVLAATGDHLLGYVAFSTSGELNEGIAAGTSVWVAYELSVEGSGGAPALSWYAYFAIVAGGQNVGWAEVTGTLGGWQKGMANLVTRTALQPGQTVSLETTIGGRTEGEALMIQVPQNSVDWNAEVVTTPEPSTMALGVAGMGALVLLRLHDGRRRRGLVGRPGALERPDDEQEAQ